MKKATNRKGFTLIELLVTLMILVLLMVAMGTGMSTAVKVYKEAVYHANSHTLASMLNTTLEDMLRYSSKVITPETGSENPGKFVIGKNVIEPNGIPFLFTNAEYNAQNAYVLNTEADGNPVQIRNILGGRTRDVLNKGAYPSLTVTDLEIVYDEDTAMFDVSYIIKSADEGLPPLNVATKVRVLNK